jgi:hypothetical protein
MPTHPPLAGFFIPVPGSALPVRVCLRWPALHKVAAGANRFLALA